MAGRQHHRQLRIGFEQPRPGLQRARPPRLPACCRPPSAADRAASAFSRRVASASSAARTSNFRFPATETRSGSAADGLQPFGIRLALRQHPAEPAKKRPPQPAQPPVARPGAVGDAGIDHGDGNSPAKAAAEQVGPELGLGQHEQPRLERVQVSPHRPGQVQRAIKDALRPEALAGQRLAGARGGGDRPADTPASAASSVFTSRLTASTSPTETAWTQMTARLRTVRTVCRLRPPGAIAPSPGVPAALRGTFAWWPCATATTARRPPGPPARPDCRKTESCVTELAFPQSNPQMIQSSTMRNLAGNSAVAALAGAAGRGQRPHAASGAAGHVVCRGRGARRRKGGHRRRTLRHAREGSPSFASIISATA